LGLIGVGDREDHGVVFSSSGFREDVVCEIVLGVEDGVISTLGVVAVTTTCLLKCDLLGARNRKALPGTPRWLVTSFQRSG